MYHFFVYLIKSKNRLVIVREKIDNQDYFYLMDNHGDDEHLCEYFCKIFCIGYIQGAKNSTEPVNDINEFQ